MIEFTRKEVETTIKNLEILIEIRRESYINKPNEFTAKIIREAQERLIALSILLKNEGDTFQF